MFRFLKSYLAAGKIAGAAIVSNLVALAVAPFITRLYEPADFGVYSLFIALTFADVVICLGLERSIPIVSDDAEAGALFGLSLIVAAGVAAVFMAAGVTWLLAVDDVQAAAAIIVLCLPPCMLLVGMMNALISTCIREHDYNSVAVARIAQGVMVAVVQLGTVGFMFRDTHLGLVLGHIGGALSAVVFLLLMNRAVRRGAIRRGWRQRSDLFRRHRAYLTRVAPAVLTNSMTLQAPIILVGALFDPVTTGLFGLTQRIAGAPMAVIGIAVGQVFGGKAASIIRAGGTAREVDLLYRRTAGLMALAGVPILLLWFPAPWLFGRVFGSEWETAGLFYRSMVPLYFIQLVVAPLQSLFIVIDRHGLYLKAEAWRLGLVLAAFGIAHAAELSAQSTLLVLATLAAGGYLVSARFAIGALREQTSRQAPVAGG